MLRRILARIQIISLVLLLSAPIALLIRQIAFGFGLRRVLIKFLASSAIPWIGNSPYTWAFLGFEILVALALAITLSRILESSALKVLQTSSHFPQGLLTTIKSTLGGVGRQGSNLPRVLISETHFPWVMALNFGPFSGKGKVILVSRGALASFEEVKVRVLLKRANDQLLTAECFWATLSFGICTFLGKFGDANWLAFGSELPSWGVQKTQNLVTKARSGESISPADQPSVNLPPLSVKAAFKVLVLLPYYQWAMKLGVSSTQQFRSIYTRLEI